MAIERVHKILSCNLFCPTLYKYHGVQRRMVLVDIFRFLELNFFAYLLLHVT